MVIVEGLVVVSVVALLVVIVVGLVAGEVVMVAGVGGIVAWLLLVVVAG